MNKLFLIIAEVGLLVVILNWANCFGLERRSAVVPERASEDYPDYQLGVKYDEYPMIVPKKRTAMLVNRLMVALKEAIQDEETSRLTNRIDGYPSSKSYSMSPKDVRSMDLQRRGHGSMQGQQKGRVYWRCYFNAVTCF